jgi:hypothetical protein
MKSLVLLLKQCRSAQRDAAQARVQQAERRRAAAQAAYAQVQGEAQAAQAALRDHAQGSAVQIMALGGLGGLGGQAALDLRQALLAAAQQKAHNCVQKLLSCRTELDSSEQELQARLKERAACEKALVRTDELAAFHRNAVQAEAQTREQLDDDDLATGWRGAWGRC